MRISPEAQGLALLWCLAAGAGLGLLYDLLRQLRLSLSRSWLREGLDLLFWVLAGGCLLLCARLLGDGRVRLYMAGGLALGAVLYFLTFSPPLRRLLGLLARVIRVLLAPLGRIWSALAAPMIKNFSRWKNSLKKRFSFSGLWSKIYHPSEQGGEETRPEEKEAFPCVSEQKGWDPPADPADRPAGLHDLPLDQRSEADHRYPD